MKKPKFNRFKYTLKALFTPSCWLLIGHTDSACDKAILGLIESNKFKPHLHPDGKHNVYTIRLGAYVFWISNFPYYSFSFKAERIIYPYSGVSCLKKGEEGKINSKMTKPLLPTRAVVLFARDRLLYDLVSQGIDVEEDYPKLVK